MQHCVFDESSDGNIPQNADSRAAIEIFFKFGAFRANVFNGEQMFPLASARSRHGVTESESDQLDEPGKVTMRQVTTLVPAKKTQGFRLVREPTRPTILLAYKLSEIFPLGTWRHFRSAGLRPGAFLFV